MCSWWGLDVAIAEMTEDNYLHQHFDSIRAVDLLQRVADYYTDAEWLR